MISLPDAVAICAVTAWLHSARVKHANPSHAKPNITHVHVSMFFLNVSNVICLQWHPFAPVLSGPQRHLMLSHSHVIPFCMHLYACLHLLFQA